MREAVSFRDLYRQYSDRVQFLIVYIREAHPTDGWDIGGEVRAGDPRTMEERRRLAGRCEEAMAHGIHTYVDEMDDAVMTAYAAWPERLYLIGQDGCVVYRGGPGPHGFEPAELERAIKELEVEGE